MEKVELKIDDPAEAKEARAKLRIKLRTSVGTLEATDGVEDVISGHILRK